MNVRLFELVDHPGRVAISNTGSYIIGGAFFLDFSRGVKVRRWFGKPNWRFGITVGLMVPVIHESEQKGEFVVGIHRSEPCFVAVRTLWKTRYPSIATPPSTMADGLKIISDFANQFPNDC
jgi:hypothetical protein